MENGVEINESGGEDDSYVVAGAILSCSSGTQLNRLKLPSSHGVYVKDKPQMNVKDSVLNVNVMPFGRCFSPINPAVQAGEMDIEGVMKAPCVPLLSSQWTGGKENVLVEGAPALVNKCTLMCTLGGCITIEDDGQELGGVSVASPAANTGGI
ncbi:DUF4280 domain-containing protein [Paenibacillus pinihumi]|uniref:DUF4280 domain-containing protein n=1 Tax=Paenibacillus pinihumi TaxID=669462 RepID=UPI0009DB973E